MDFSGGFVLGCDVHNTVGVDVEGNLDLRMATGSHWNARKLEVAKLLVVFRELALTLKDRDADFGLVVSSGGEGL